MGGILLRLRTWWETADRTQKAVTLFGGGFLALLLLGTFYFASRPKMTPAYYGLSPSDVGVVTQEIEKLGIPVDMDLQGNVLVPSEKVPEVHAKLAASGKAPASGHASSVDLNKLSNFSTPQVEREQLKAILEGELAQSIEQLQGVGSARVHINLGEETAFASETKPASASITVGDKGGLGLGPDVGHSIALLVANSTPGLDTAHVFVLDTSGHPLYDGAQAQSPMGSSGTKLATESQQATKREREIQADLDAAFGRGNTIVKVNLTMNFNEQTVDTVTPIVGNEVQVTKQTEKMGSGGAANASSTIAGIGSNTGTTPTSNTSAAPGASGDKGYDGQIINTTNATGSDHKIVRSEVGALAGMSITVIANSAKNVDTKAIESYLSNYLAPFKAGPNQAAFTSAVTTTAFDTTDAAAIAKSSQDAAGRDKMQQYFSLLPVGALLIVGFLVIKSIAKAAKAQNVVVRALPGGHYAEDQTGSSAADGGSAPITGSAGILKRAMDDAHQVIPMSQEDVGEIAERLNRPLEQIKRMTQERPDAVAMLIKSWLLEEKR